MTLAASRSDRASSATVRPYPLLISMVVVPCAQRLSAQPAHVARSSSSAAARVARDSGRGCRRRCRAAGHPGGELRRPVAGEDQVGVAVHEAGQHARRPPASIRVVGGGRVRARPDPGDPVAVDHAARRPRRMPSGRRRRGRVVGDQLADVVDEQGHGVDSSARHQLLDRGGSAAGTSHGDVAAVDHHDRPSTTTCVTSAAVAAKTTPAVAHRRRCGPSSRP